MGKIECKVELKPKFKIKARLPRIPAKTPKYFTRTGITKNSSTCTSGYSMAKASSSERDRQ